MTQLYAEAAHSKSMWAQTTDKTIADRYLNCDAGDRMIDTPARDFGELALKLGEAIEWVAPDVGPAAFRLLRSVLEDMKRLATPEPPKERDHVAYLNGRIKEERAKARKSARPRCCRPVKVDGVRFPSISAAARATGLPYHRLKAM